MKASYDTTTPTRYRTAEVCDRFFPLDIRNGDRSTYDIFLREYSV